ncbi:MAG: hypothetical protein LBH09_07920 [Peptococcaceae bacterium]|jgi:hypothetical protein|nr:hypothetical protein [Peptococcaceae bacterium]
MYPGDTVRTDDSGVRHIEHGLCYNGGFEDWYSVSSSSNASSSIDYEQVAKDLGIPTTPVIP